MVKTNMHLERIPHLSFTKKDFKIDWFSGTGAGGQHRNKHQNCCRITHIESGMMETGQNFRERSRNQKEAFTKLAHRVVNLYNQKESRKRYESDETIRTYHEPRNIVKDHASGETIQYSDLDKEFEQMVNARLGVKQREEDV
jgi:protein subunit release factor A